MMPMRRLPIQIDEKTYAALRRRAFEEKRSIASIVRECLEKAEEVPQARSASDFSFVGSGASRQRRIQPVSEDHDEALAQALRSRRRRK